MSGELWLREFLWHVSLSPEADDTEERRAATAGIR
jgi:hypothetical protein